MEHIVVGVDESPGAASALRWAIRERAVRGGSLTAVLAWTYFGQHDGGSGDGVFRPDYGEREAAAALQQICERAALNEHRTIRQQLVCDLPSRALLTASADADLLVVGARGYGRFRGALVGSVSQQCAHHSTVPVAIVRDRSGPALPDEPIVVGVDGSTTSKLALAWAVDEARARGAAMTVVHAWQFPITVGPVVPRIDAAPFEAAAKELVADALSGADPTGLRRVETQIVREDAAAALVEAAESASLVVVGSRGRGGFAGLLLGSVSQRVVLHSPCPVVVVPREQDCSAG